MPRRRRARPNRVAQIRRVHRRMKAAAIGLAMLAQTIDTPAPTMAGIDREDLLDGVEATDG